MTKWNMIVDVARCENCHNCTLSVKDEHVDNDFPGYAAPQQRHGRNWIEIERKVRGQGHMVDSAYLPRMCNHCDDAPCLKAGGADGAVRKRADGIVLIDPVKAKGRKDLVDACPYGAIVWNPEQNLPQAWLFDAHLLDKGWKEPRASQACPTEALKAVQLSDAEMTKKAKAEGLEILKPELGTRPRVYYRNLHRFTQCFVGGTVTAKVNGRLECVEGASVTLVKDGAGVAAGQSDMFGDFKFDRLQPDSGKYELLAEHPELGSARASVNLGESVYAGELTLSKMTT